MNLFLKLAPLNYMRMTFFIVVTETLSKIVYLCMNMVSTLPFECLLPPSAEIGF